MPSLALVADDRAFTDQAYFAALHVEHRRRKRPEEDPERSELQAVTEMRRHLLWYTRWRRGGVHFRRDSPALRTVADVRRALERHFPRGGAGFDVDTDAGPARGDAVGVGEGDEAAGDSPR